VLGFDLKSCAIEFLEYTGTNHLRHSKFVRLREGRILEPSVNE
jgi:hypothetical protein